MSKLSYVSRTRRIAALAIFSVGVNGAFVHAQETATAPKSAPESAAVQQQDFKPYEQPLEHTEQVISMVPIPGGKFMMGSPEDEDNRNDDEGPQREVEISPFWMSKYEITWDQYDAWAEEQDQLRRKALGIEPTKNDQAIDGISRPTPPYTDMSFGMGKGNYPAISMTQHAARTYCQWLSAKTGHYYRLPTEAEWEYAARAGTTTAYSFGDERDDLEDYGWFSDNSDEYHEVGELKPNPWGLYDMHGNVSEWVLDQYVEDSYSKAENKDPLNIPTTEYPRVVRGGGWENEGEMLRSAVRVGSDLEWKVQDPQLPQSIWYLTDAQGVGFRIVRPLNEPSAEERAAKWDKSDPPQVDQE